MLVSSRISRSPLGFLIVAVAVLLGLAGCTNRPAADPAPQARRSRVLLVALDGAALPFVRAAVKSGALPNFSKLMRGGASGYLASIYRDLPFSGKRGPGYWSPIVWTSISTGKSPEIHGVVDFLVPDPAETRLCTQAVARQATIRVPLKETSAGIRLTLTADSGHGWTVRSETSKLPTTLAPGATVKLPVSDRIPVSREVLLHATASALDAAPLCLQDVSLVDGNGNVAEQLHFRLVSQLYEKGWGAPTFGKLHSAGTAHRRVSALWNIVGEAGHKVAIVRWRDSWPAEVVNGYFVSDRLGLRSASKPDHVNTDPRQLYPPELMARARPLLDQFREADAVAVGELFKTPCDVPNLHVARVQHWDDWLSHRLALELWTEDDEIDLMAVYYRGIDAFGHMYLDETPPESGACSVEPSMVARYYQVVDRYLGDWIQQLDENTTIVIVADHGMLPGEGHGEHADNGLAILYGATIRAGGQLRGMGVLDIAPLTLYLLDMPVPADMPGKPPWYAISPERLASRPARVVATYETKSHDTDFVEAAPEVEQEVIEKLRALGYVE
jgi:predicted AlkP superfamily phosphohydrolase/phosphomutase